MVYIILIGIQKAPQRPHQIGVVLKFAGHYLPPGHMVGAGITRPHTIHSSPVETDGYDPPLQSATNSGNCCQSRHTFLGMLRLVRKNKQNYFHS